MLLDEDDVPLPLVLELLDAPVPVAGVTVDSVVPLVLVLPVAGGVEELAVSGGVVAEEDEVAGGIAVSVVAEDELVAGGMGGAAVVLLLEVPVGGVTTVVRSSLRSQPARPMASAATTAPVSTRLDFIGAPFVWNMLDGRCRHPNDRARKFGATRRVRLHRARASYGRTFPAEHTQSRRHAA